MSEKEQGRKIGQIVITFREGEKPEFDMTGIVPPRQITAMPYNLRKAFRVYQHQCSKASMAAKQQEIADAVVVDEPDEAPEKETTTIDIPTEVTPVAEETKETKPTSYRAKPDGDKPEEGDKEEGSAGADEGAGTDD